VFEFSPPLSLLVKILGTQAGAKYRHVPPLQMFLKKPQESIEAATRNAPGDGSFLFLSL
jgi:hypothetical protein